MPIPAATRLLGRPHHFRHYSRRRATLLLAYGMLSILTLVCFLAAPRLAAVESLARLPVLVPPPQDQASMTSSQDAYLNEPPQTPPQTGLNIPHHPHSHSWNDDHDMQQLDQKPISNLATGIHHPPIADLPKRLSAHLPLNLTCNPSLDPSDHQKKRIIFVGDVHGHLRSLKALLHKLQFDEKNGDHLVFVGDLVNKGPDSAGVVALAMDVGASAVRGNHEDNVLRAHKALEKKKKKHRKSQEILETVPDRGADGSAFGSQEDFTETRKKHDDQARHTAKSLSKKQINWLSSLPLMLRLDHLQGATHPPWNAKEIIVVHAGLVPALPVNKQDPWAVMNMRTLLYRLRAKSDEVPEAADALPPSAETERRIEAIPSDDRHGEPWSHSWNRFQNLTFPLHSDRTLVIYGHDAKSGLQANPRVVIKPHPATRRGKHLGAAAAQKRNDVNGIEVNIGPEIEVENDGDVAIDVDSRVTINATTTTNTSDSEAEARKKRTDIEINVDPTEVLDADGDVEAEVEGEFEIEIENETDDKRRRKTKRDDNDDTIELSATPVIAVEADGDVDVAVEVDMEVAVVNGSVHPANGTMCKRDGEGVVVVQEDGEVVDENVADDDADNDDDDDDDDDETGSDNDVEAERRKKKKGGKKGSRKRNGVRYAFGIDSGCGHGRKLTALILEATEPDGVVIHRLEQVDCGAEGRG